jgi:hypothetical protein
MFGVPKYTINNPLILENYQEGIGRPDFPNFLYINED